MLTYITLRVGQLGTNCYLVFDRKTKDGIIVDPGDDAEYISDAITRYAVRPTGVFATHGHFDHILAAFALTNIYGIPFAIHEKDTFLVERMQDTARRFLGIETDPKPEIHAFLKEGDTIPVGMASLDVLASPGHTPGSVCFSDAANMTLLTGDTIFEGGGVGRTDHSYSDPDALKRSVDMILTLPEATTILSGHGNPTTVGAERVLHVQ